MDSFRPENRAMNLRLRHTLVQALEKSFGAEDHGLSPPSPNSDGSSLCQPSLVQPPEQTEAEKSAAQLRALHAERRARQVEAETLLAAAEAAARDALRAEEDARRAVVARQKKERRKAKKVSSR